MEDTEIIDNLKRASALLREYMALAKPAAEALALRKSMALFGRGDCYVGELGCHDSGPNVICLHITDEACDLVTTDGGVNGPDWIDRVMEWENGWRDRLEAAGITRIWLDGHY